MNPGLSATMATMLSPGNERDQLKHDDENPFGCPKPHNGTASDLDLDVGCYDHSKFAAEQTAKN